MSRYFCHENPEILRLETHVVDARPGRVLLAAMNDDATARIDFDLPDADNDRLRGLQEAINDTIRQDLPIRETYMEQSAAHREQGLVRSRSVAPPPTTDGKIRVIEIVSVDRQACGGTHLASTGGSRPIRILKIENKGRHNRRMRIGLESRP